MIGYGFIVIGTIVAVLGWKNGIENKWVIRVIVLLIIGGGLYSIYDKYNSDQKITRLEMMASPPHLIAKERSFEKIEEGYRVTVKFHPSKNEAFGIITIIARLPEDSDARISRVEVAITGSKHKEDISPNNKMATLIFQPASIGVFSVYIDVDSPTTLFIEGTNNLEPFSIEVK